MKQALELARHPKTSRRNERRLKLIGLAAALATLPCLMSSTTAEATVGARCGFATVVGVRGSLEPAGMNLTNGGRTYRAGGLGDVIRAFGIAVQSDPSMPVHVEALNYPAVVADPGNSQASNYTASVNVGARNLALEIKDLARTCPSKPIILAGYSQGAEVISQALGQYNGGAAYVLTASEKSKIRAVVLFGAPSYRAGQAWNAPGNGPSSGVFGLPPNVNHHFAPYKALTWLPPSYPTQGLRPVIRSYCLSGDYFCQRNLTAEGKRIHASYATSSTIGSAQGFVFDWLIDPS